MDEVIHRTTQEDIPHIKQLSHKFNDQYYGIPLNDDKLDKWLEFILTIGVGFHTAQGFIAGFPVGDPVRDWTALVENAWYAEDRSGVKLLEKFIEHGRQEGCNEVRMTTLNTTPEGVNRLLVRMGFEEVERSHRLTL